MANLNKENIITVDVKNATVKTEGSMSFYITDIKTCNIYCQLVINESKSTLVKNYAPIENAEDFNITMRLIKPNNEPKELSFSLLNQVEAFFYVDLTDEYKDCIGTYNCELFVDCLVNGELERITTSSFTYRVNASIMNKLDDVIDNIQSNPLIEALATKEYVDNIVYVIDKTETEEGITYEDFENGGCTCKLSGSLYFGNTYFTFDDELVYVVKTDYSNMKKLYVYRITTAARPGGGATADYIVLDYKEGTYEAYNYMLEEIEHKADQVKLDLLNIIDDANYAPVTYVNDRMRATDEITREYVNNCIEDIVNYINTAEYATESYVNDKVFALRTDFVNNFASLSYVNDAITNAMNDINLSSYATHTYVSNFFNNSINGRLTDYATKIYVDDEIRELSRSMLNLSDVREYIVIYMADYLWVNEYTTKDYVAEQIANAQLGGEGGTVNLSQYATKDYVHEYVSNNAGSGGSGDCNCDLSQYATKSYVDEAVANIDIPDTDLSDYATTEYVDGIIPVIDKTGTDEGILYEDFTVSGTYKLNGAMRINNTFVNFNNELVFVIKTDLPIMKRLVIYRTASRGNKETMADYIAINYNKDTGEISSVSHDNYAYESYVDDVINNLKSEYLLENYATMGYIDNKLSDIETLLGEI